MKYRIVFSPSVSLFYQANSKERFVPNADAETRKDAERTLETLQEIGTQAGLYKIVEFDYKLKEF